MTGELGERTVTDERGRFIESPGAAHILERLAARRSDIAREICAYVQEAVPDRVDRGEDAAYQAGLLAAVEALLDYALEGIKHGPGYSASLPTEAMDQARRAARIGVGATVVLRRYVAGHRRLGELIVEEAEHAGLNGDNFALHALRQTQDVLLERLVAAIECEYDREHDHMAVSEQQRSGIVRALVRGEAASAAELAALGYEIASAWHIGLVIAGPGVEAALRCLESTPGFNATLAVSAGHGIFWVWLGVFSAEMPSVERVEAFLAEVCDISAAIGGPGHSMTGWLQTHREASAALLAVRGPRRLVRYSDKPLLIAALENETLRVWLEGFLAPLRRRPDGETLMRTMRAYIDAECNRSSAAAILKQEVRRQAIGDRLRTTERLLKRPIRTCLAELDAALCLEDMAAIGEPGHRTTL